jgi:hypothetical protein
MADACVIRLWSSLVALSKGALQNIIRTDRGYDEQFKAFAYDSQNLVAHIYRPDSPDGYVMVLLLDVTLWLPPYGATRLEGD